MPMAQAHSGHARATRGSPRSRTFPSRSRAGSPRCAPTECSSRSKSDATIPKGPIAENAVAGQTVSARRGIARRCAVIKPSPSTFPSTPSCSMRSSRFANTRISRSPFAARAAARSADRARCGSTGTRNLACKSKLAEFTKDGKTRVESPPSMPIIRDLVCDMKPFWDKHLAVKPWLENKQPVPPADQEYRVPNASMEELIQEVSCISCGACLMDCESFAVNPDFLGPQALAQAYRYVGDPRDAKTKQRSRRAKQAGRHLGLHALLRVRHAVPEGRRAARADSQAAQDGRRRRLHAQCRDAPRRRLRRIGSSTAAGSTSSR